MARAAAAAAGEEAGVQVVLKRAVDAGPADVLAADGYLFATPENLAAVAGLMKDFFDRCYYPALERIGWRLGVRLSERLAAAGAGGSGRAGGAGR